MSSWTSSFCETNGTTIHYLRTGEGQGKPPLLLLHGLGASGACWTPLARFLQGAFDVVMPDARGHGQSDTPLHGYMYSDHARDVVALIEVLRLSTPLLLGHSMGGLTAAVVASQPRTALRGVILVDPTFISPAWQREVYESPIVEEHRQLLCADPSDLLAQARLRHPRRSTEILELLTRARLQTHVEAFKVLTPPNPEYHTLVSTIRSPLLLVIGSQGVVSVETARELEELNPGLQYEVIPDVGHGLPYDEPEKLSAAVKSFARNLVES